MDLVRKVRTHCMDMPYWLTGSESDWSHHPGVPGVERGHRLLAFTMMLLNGPEYDGEYGSLLDVILKQRPQASPAPE